LPGLSRGRRLPKKVPQLSSTRVESIEDIDALPTDTPTVLVVRLDDRKIAALSRLNALQNLYQDGPSGVTDQGLCYLVTFSALEVLDLAGSREITDQGLAELRLVRSLRWLDLTDCSRLTEAGLGMLRAALPRCEIVA
jgi:hypothetical protein